jgi:argininosuccinate synthase
MKNEALVLAYSGGLDTSYSLRKLSKEGYDVHAISVNTGGFSDDEIKTIETKAYQMGAFTYQNINALDSFYQKIVKYLLFGQSRQSHSQPHVSARQQGAVSVRL